MKLNFFHSVKGKSSLQLHTKLLELQKIFEDKFPNPASLLSSYERTMQRLHATNEELSETICCFDCQFALINQREAIEKRLKSYEVWLHLLDEITFLEGYIPYLFEYENERLVY